MAFGTFTLFNFYQQPNTGRTPPRDSYDAGYIVTGGGRQGRVSDQNWDFPYAGNLVPNQVVEGGGGLFQVTLFSDSTSEPGDSWTGLHPAQIQTVISGQFQGDVEHEYFNTLWSGSFSKHVYDAASSLLVISGAVTGSPNDPSYLSFRFSGLFASGESDKTSLNSLWSGSFETGRLDRTSIYSRISGKLSTNQSEKSSIQSKISGKFYPIYSDICTINMAFSGYYSDANMTWTGEVLEDDTTITYSLDSYSSFR